MRVDRSRSGERRRRSSAHLCRAIVLLLVLTACGSDAESPRANPSPTVEEGTAFVTVWLAGLRTAEDPNDLDDDTQELLAIVPSALVVSPVVCFRDLPEALADQSDYVLGLISETRNELEHEIAKTGREPLFVVRVRDYCLD